MEGDHHTAQIDQNDQPFAGELLPQGKGCHGVDQDVEEYHDRRNEYAVEKVPGKGDGVVDIDKVVDVWIFWNQGGGIEKEILSGQTRF